MSNGKNMSDSKLLKEILVARAFPISQIERYKQKHLLKKECKINKTKDKSTTLKGVGTLCVSL